MKLFLKLILALAALASFAHAQQQTGYMYFTPITAPGSLNNGYFWYDTGSNAFRARVNGATVTIGTSGGTPPGGSNGQIQFNNSGVFGGYTIVPVANGGTGASSNTSNAILTGGGASAINSTDASMSADGLNLTFDVNGAGGTVQGSLVYNGTTGILNWSAAGAISSNNGFLANSNGATLPGYAFLGGGGTGYGMYDSTLFGGAVGFSVAGSTVVLMRPTSLVSVGGFSAGSAAIATTATGGFINYDTMAGVPTGTPAAITGVAGLTPTVIDSTDSRLYAYLSGAWVNLTAGSGITALTGDVSASGSGSVATTLATVNSNVGSFTNANITVNAKGLVTAASNGTPAIATFVFNGAGSAVPSSVTSGKSMTYAGTIHGYYLLADVSGSITVTIQKSTAGGSYSTITASAAPALSSSNYVTSTTLTGWTTSFSAGDNLKATTTGGTTLTQATLVLY